ncbi:MAG: TSCPD domain-containing protein [Desulfatirhabdiaceae bacterium]|nr:TSCPD domain-containing protein [Desulfatirhabdiaceae bacterium]
MEQNGAKRSFGANYVFHTQGVCPPEIHFRLSGEDTVHQVRFVGGGCPGNALLVSRFVDGKPMNAIIEYLSGIECRNATSCPDQLARAFAAVKNGDLQPAATFKVAEDAVPRDRICFLGNLDGNHHVLSALLHAVKDEHVHAIYSVGNLTGLSEQNDNVVSMISKHKIQAIAGHLDWQYAQEKEAVTAAPLSLKNRDILLRLPQVRAFQIGDQKGMAFYGRYIQDLRGYSDFTPFALEMNMVCDLTRFMKDESVFPALEAMTPQFSVRLVVFSESGEWNHYDVGGVKFLGIGNANENGFLNWGILEHTAGGLKYQIRKTPFNPE